MTTETHSISVADLERLVRQRAGFDKGRASSIADTKARLAPSEAAVRRAIDQDMIERQPARSRGKAARIVNLVKSHPDVIAYRNANQLPDTAHAWTQWVSRILRRLNRSPSAG